MERQLISIIINNYNYGRFVYTAIESALSQTDPAHEIIVVDDGSTDDSKEVIGRYKDRVHIIEKANGGQASAFNAGFKAATGNWIWFLDADDWLQEDAIGSVMKVTHPGIAKIHGPLTVTDEAGVALGYTLPSIPLSEGDVIPVIEQFGGYAWPPTSGNIFSRQALEKCMPVPEDEYRLCADLYICSYAALYGKIIALPKPIAYYRIHSQNGFYGFRMQSTWLQKQAQSILQAHELANTILYKAGKNKITNGYGRRNTEMLMIAARFGGVAADQISGKRLQSNWWHSSEIKQLTGSKKTKAVIYWMILSYAPGFIAKPIVTAMTKRTHQNLLSVAPPLN